MGCRVQAQHPNNFLESTLSGKAQGTTYTIKYYANTLDLIPKQSIDSILNVIDRSMSIYNPHSLISKFNQSSTKSIKMDPHMQKVVKESKRMHKLTQGYFDITIYPLIQLWGFGPSGFQRAPTQHELDSVARFVGMKNIKSCGSLLRKRNMQASIDLNGIAQGYSVDVLAQYLEEKGIQNYMVELGGEIRSKGTKASGPFIVEIQRPYSSADKRGHKIKLINKSITTSGNYERQLTVAGKRVSHHMNPFTKYPIENSTISVTVIANSAMEADALDNYLMFLSPEEAIAFANKRKDVEVYLIYFENNIFKELQSSGFNNYIYK